jgi:hypothetical protein
MSIAPASPSEPLESDRPTERRCPRCGDRLDRAWARVQGVSKRRTCIDCAFDDAPQTE